MMRCLGMVVWSCCIAYTEVFGCVSSVEVEGWVVGYTCSSMGKKEGTVSKKNMI